MLIAEGAKKSSSVLGTCSAGIKGCDFLLNNDTLI
jgi:hypothetical protein